MAEKPSVARFLVSSDQPLELTMALPLAEIIHQALVKFSNGSCIFTGCDSSHSPLKGHKHAYILCESNQSQGKGSQGDITHVTVFSSSGFGSHDRKVLQNLEHIYGENVPDIQLSLMSLGHPRDFGGTDLDLGQCPLLAKSSTWISQTPFIPVRHPKITRAGAPKLDERGLQIDSPEHELRRLLRLDGFPEPSIVESVLRTSLGGRNEFWASFQIQREKNYAAERTVRRIGYGFRIQFPGPVQGPMALGYAAHLGMGSFVAVADRNKIAGEASGKPLLPIDFQKKGDIQICLLDVKIRFLTQAYIPLWTGDSFRAGLGNKLRDRVCAFYVNSQKDPSIAMKEYRNCRKNCELSQCCSYGRLFVSLPKADQDGSVRFFEPPLPLILIPPATGSYDPDEFASVGFATIGQASDTLPYIFLALRDLGKSGLGRDRHIGGGRFNLDSADSLTPQERKQVYHNDNLQNMISSFSYFDILRQAEGFNGSVALKFLTPTHIGDEIGYSSRPSFGMLLMHLLLRANTLSSSHGTGYLYNPRECQNILENAEKVEQVSAFVKEIHARRQANMNNEFVWQPPYFLGEIIYRGSFSKDMMALLSLGEIIHVGRAATIGNGMFKMQRHS
ncbi:MAG: type I-U CRISPR-associated protein Csb2 [Methanothrix sp.]|nr:type I-U CRISPR-associated protein Csb2 [Methanothrix sp.]